MDRAEKLCKQNFEQRKVSEIMKNTTKKLLAVLSATTLLTSASLAMADDYETMLISVNEESPIYVNETLLDKTTKTVGDAQFLPLRAVCEALGFEVNWIEESRTIEIVDLPRYITCSPDRDGYTFAKTAPILLGSAPILIVDLTYVPANFVDEIIGYSLIVEDGVYHIPTEASEPEAETVEVTATIVDFIYDENDKLIQIVTGDAEDPNQQLIFNLSEELIEKISEYNLEAGMTITGQAVALMTNSIPPQQPLLTIDNVEATQAPETVVVTGEIVELIYDENDKLVQILTGDKEDPNQQLIFNLSEDLTNNASELGLEVGKTITGDAVALQTMSIPPQQPLLTITEVK